MLPVSPGRQERHGFEYKRNETLSLYAALNVGTAAVERMTAAYHTSAEFLRFLDRVVATQSPRREIHLIADNLSAHKTKAVPRGWRRIRASRCNTRPPTVPGCMKLNSGSPRSNAT